MKDDENSVAGGEEAALCFLEALGRRDFEALEGCLAEDVWFRALLPKRLVEKNTATATIETYRSWFGEAAELESLETAHHSMQGRREFLRYRLAMKPDPSSETRQVTEQVGFCRVEDGKISRLDIVCAGLFPEVHSREIGALSPDLPIAR